MNKVYLLLIIHFYCLFWLITPTDANMNPNSINNNLTSQSNNDNDNNINEFGINNVFDWIFGR